MLCTTCLLPFNYLLLRFTKFWYKCCYFVYYVAIRFNVLCCNCWLHCFTTPYYLFSTLVITVYYVLILLLLVYWLCCYVLLLVITCHYLFLCFMICTAFPTVRFKRGFKFGVRPEILFKLSPNPKLNEQQTSIRTPNEVSVLFPRGFAGPREPSPGARGAQGAPGARS